MHRAKGDRSVRARVLPVSDNAVKCVKAPCGLGCCPFYGGVSVVVMLFVVLPIGCEVLCLP